MNRFRHAAFLAVLGFLARPALAQQPAPDQASLRGDSAQTRKRLTEADQKLNAGKPAEAIDAIQRVLDEAGDDLVSLDGKHYRPARSVAHQLLARLPAESLKTYQDRIDEPARKLLEVAKKNRDPAPLWQLLDRYFVSRMSEEASLFLGDLLFDRGEFLTAERVWRRLLPDAGADLVYPGAKTDPAAVRARLILAATFAGELDRAKTDLTAFKAKHPNAKGAFAGKDGPYADALQAYLDAPPKFPAPANPGRDWPTFGGGPARSGRVGVRLPADWIPKPAWEVSVPSLPRHHRAALYPPVRQPVGHPIIANGQVLVTNGYTVYGYDLVTGDKVTELSLVTPHTTGAIPEKAPHDACPALTAAGNLVYVRAGQPLVRSHDTRNPAQPSVSKIFCLGSSGEDKELKELWELKPPVSEEKSPTVWEGAPLVAGRRMWAAYARFEGGRIVYGIACYDPADAEKAPERPAWSADVCDSPLPVGGDGRARQELLTLAGRNVVFCSNAGAVVALDSVTGRRAWGFRYPRGRKSNANASAAPSPAVACDGRVFVAPADADRVYALDPETGEPLWESGPAEGAQILGVAAGKVIVSVTGPARGLRGLDVTTGEGWVQHTGGGLLSYGHGFVTDDAIVWPTHAGLFFCRPEDGRPIANRDLLRAPFRGTNGRYFGNLAYADGVMVVVTPTQIWGYVSDRKRFAGLEERSARDPVRERFEDLIERAENALADGDQPTAREALRTAAQPEFPKPLRAWAVARLLLLTPKVDDEAKLPGDLRAVLAAELSAEWLFPPDGVPATLGTLLDRHVGRPPAQKFLPTSAIVAEPAPTLSPSATVARTLRLPRGSAPLRWLAGAETQPKRLFAITADELVAVPFGTGEVARYEVIEGITHAAEFATGFVVAGPSAVAVYATDRTPAWVFRVPLTPSLPKRAGEFSMARAESAAVAELSSFRLMGAWLVARLGDRHLVALDLKGKRVAWVLGANGKPGFQAQHFPDDPRFAAEFGTIGRLLVVQVSNGRRWLVQAETGKLSTVAGNDLATARVMWSLPPVEVEANRLAVADGPGLVRMLNLVTNRVKWTHVVDNSAGLTGEPPQVRAWGSTIIVAVRRNHGTELDRLDMDEGKSVWLSSEPPFLDANAMTLAHADADAERLYVPSGNTLTAIALKDGKPAWDIELPATNGAGGWVVRAGRKCLVVYPTGAVPGEPVGDLRARLARSFRANQRVERLPGLLMGLYDAWVTRSVPVLLLDPETGKQLARFDIPATGPPITAYFSRDVAVVATGDRVCWFR